MAFCACLSPDTPLLSPRPCRQGSWQRICGRKRAFGWDFRVRAGSSLFRAGGFCVLGFLSFSDRYGPVVGRFTVWPGVIGHGEHARANRFRLRPPEKAEKWPKLAKNASFFDPISRPLRESWRPSDGSIVSAVLKSTTLLLSVSSCGHYLATKKAHEAKTGRELRGYPYESNS